MNWTLKLSIIIPAYNEEGTIIELIEYINSLEFPVDHEIIIIDDGSLDRTFEKTAEFLNKSADRLNIRIIRNAINKGKGYSIRKGIEHADGDIIVIQDADFEYDPKDIVKLITPIMDGEAQVVYGSRFLKARWPTRMNIPNWIANKILTKLVNILFDVKLTDMETCYKTFKIDVVRDLKLKGDRFSFEPEVTSLIGKCKIRIKEVPISYTARTTDEGKKINITDFFEAIKILIGQRFFDSN